MAIEPNETLISGGWILVEGRMVPDDSQLRIRTLIETQLERIGSTSDGWETLFKDRSDGRLWELLYPQSEMHAGGPESLRFIDAVQAANKYGYKFDVAAQPAPSEIDFAGMTTNERLCFSGLLPEWDAAAHLRDRERLIEILCRVGLSTQAHHITETFLANPQRYGF